MTVTVKPYGKDGGAPTNVVVHFANQQDAFKTLDTVSCKLPFNIDGIYTQHLTKAGEAGCAALGVSKDSESR